MYYSLNADIYLVKGSRFNCIYDVPHNKLHKIGNDAYCLLQEVIAGKDITDPKELRFLDSLVSMQIAYQTELPNKDYKTIDEVYSYDRKLDFAWIELTNLCNLKCIHCYNEHSECSKASMSLEDFKWAVDQLLSVGVEKIQLIGGEPFLINKDTLFKMMDYLAGKVKDFELFTNGTIASEEDWKEIRKRYPNVCVATSLHSYLEVEHEKVTQVKGSFNKSENTIKILKSLNIPYRFVGTLIGGLVIGENKELGEPSRRDFVRMSGRANLNLYDDDLLHKRIITEKMLHGGVLKERLKDIYESNCFSTHLYIGCDMNVYPCPMERRLCHGNLKGATLKELLDPKILNYSKDTVIGCKDCEYRYICRDCRPDSLTGNLSEKPWYCTYDPHTGFWETFDEFKQRLFNKE